MELQNIKSKKSKIIAIILYICLAPFCIGELYLGYKERFKKQILRYVYIIILIILLFTLKKNIIITIAICIISFLIFITHIRNIIKGFRILFGNIKEDAFGNPLE